MHEACGAGQGGYAVTLDVDATVSNLMVGAMSGALTLSLPGHTLTIGGQGKVRSTGLYIANSKSRSNGQFEQSIAARFPVILV